MNTPPVPSQPCAPVCPRCLVAYVTCKVCQGTGYFSVTTLLCGRCKGAGTRRGCDCKEAAGA